MAKKPTRSKADDGMTAPPAAAPKVRARAQRELGGAIANREPEPQAEKLNSLSAGPESISGQMTDAADRVQQAPGDAIAARSEQDREHRTRDSASEPTVDAIRMRAYEMYLERGGDHGLDFDDWVRAEQELRQGR
jgi:Protein of unknown function (DUF2934)